MSENIHNIARDFVEDLITSLHAPVPSPGPELWEEPNARSNLTITEILKKVATLAEGLQDALQDIQIGDFLVSMNASPLEIQVKQAINDILTEPLTKPGSLGEGDRVEDSQQPSESAADASDPHPDSCNLETLQTDQNEVIGTLKRKKRTTIRDRLRKAFRNAFRRRRDS